MPRLRKRKISKNHPNFIPYGANKEKVNKVKPKVKRRKEIAKIRAEINEN